MSKEAKSSFYGKSQKYITYQAWDIAVKAGNLRLQNLLDNFLSHCTQSLCISNNLAGLFDFCTFQRIAARFEDDLF